MFMVSHYESLTQLDQDTHIDIYEKDFIYVIYVSGVFMTSCKIYVTVTQRPKIYKLKR